MATIPSDALRNQIQLLREREHNMTRDLLDTRQELKKLLNIAMDNARHELQEYEQVNLLMDKRMGDTSVVADPAANNGGGDYRRITDDIASTYAKSSELSAAMKDQIALQNKAFQGHTAAMGPGEKQPR
jgi:hypothetical protein